MIRQRHFIKESEDNFLKYNPDYEITYRDNPEKDAAKLFSMLTFERHYACVDWIFKNARYYNKIANFESMEGDIEYFPEVLNKRPDIIVEVEEMIMIIDFTYSSPTSRVNDENQKISNYSEIAKRLGNRKYTEVVPLAYFKNMDSSFLNSNLKLLFDEFEVVSRNLSEICEYYNTLMQETRRGVKLMSEFYKALKIYKSSDHLDIFSVFEGDLLHILNTLCSSDGKYKNSDDLLRTINDLHLNDYKFGKSLDEEIINHLKSGDYHEGIVYDESNVLLIETEFQKLRDDIRNSYECYTSRSSLPIYTTLTVLSNSVLEASLKECRKDLYDLVCPSFESEIDRDFYRGLPIPTGSRTISVCAPQTLKVNKNVKSSIFGVKINKDVQNGKLKKKIIPHSFHCTESESLLMSNEIKRLMTVKETSMNFDINQFLEECKGKENSTMDKVRREAINILESVMPEMNTILTSSLYYISKLSNELLCQDYSQTKGVKKFSLDNGNLIIQGTGTKAKQYQTSRPFIHCFCTSKEVYIEKMIYGIYREYKTSNGFYLYVSEPRSMQTSMMESSASSFSTVLASCVTYAKSCLSSSYDVSSKKVTLPNQIEVSKRVSEFIELSSIIKLFCDPGVTDLLTYQRYFFMNAMSILSQTHELIRDKLNRPIKSLLESYFIFNSSRNFSHFRLSISDNDKVESNNIIKLNARLPYYPKVLISNTSCLVELQYMMFFGTKKSKKPKYSYWDTFQNFVSMNEKYISSYQNKNLSSFDFSLNNLNNFECNYSLLFRSMRQMNNTLPVPISEVYSNNFLSEVNSYSLFDSASTKASIDQNLNRCYRFQSIIDICKGRDLSFIEYLKLYIYKLKDPLYVDEMLKPEWNYDDREAFIGDIHSMTQLKIFEDFFKNLSKVSDIEMISKPGLVKNQILNSQINKASKSSSHLYQNVDKTKWNMFWDFDKNISIIASFRDFVPPGFLYYMLICAYKLKNKFVRIPLKVNANIAAVLLKRDLKQDELEMFKHHDPKKINDQYSVEMPLATFMSHFPSIKESDLKLLSQNSLNDFFKIEWGFLAGFVNFMSSYAHSAVAKYVQKTLETLSIKTSINFRHSDDSQMTTIYDSKYDKLEYAKIVSYCRRLIEENCQMRDSAKKTSISYVAFEFLSQYFISKKSLIPFIKFSSNVDDSLPFSGYMSDISAAGGFCSDLYKLGLEDVYSTAVFIVMQYNIRSYYSPRYSSIRNVNDLFEENFVDQDVKEPVKISNYAKRGTVDMVLNSFKVDGVILDKTLMPPQVFGICPLSSSVIALCGISSWYTYIYESGEYVPRLLLSTLCKEKCFVPDSFETQDSSDIFSPGTFPIPTINLKFESEIALIRSRYMSYKNVDVDNMLANPYLTLVKSSDPRTAFNQIIARLFTKGFRETFSLDSLSKVTRAIKSNNQSCVAVYNKDNEFVNNLKNIYLENVPYDEYYVLRENQRSLDKDLVTSQHMHENSISFIPYKVYVFYILYRANELLKRARLTQNYHMYIEDTVELRCTLLNNETRKIFSTMLGDSTNYEVIDNSIFFPKISIRSDNLKSGIPNLVLSLYYIDHEFAKSNFPLYEDAYKAKSFEMNDLLGVFDKNLKVSSKGLSSLECMKIIKDLSHNSIIVSSKSAMPTAIEHLRSSINKGRFFNFIKDKQLSTNIAKSVLKTEFYTINDIVSISMAYACVAKISLPKSELILTNIDRDRVPPKDASLISLIKSMSDAFCYCFFYDIIMGEKFNILLPYFTEKHLSFNIVSVERPVMQDRQRIGDLREIYSMSKKLCSVNLIMNQNDKDNIFWANFNTSHTKDDIKSALTLFGIRNDLSIYWDDYKFIIFDKITKRYVFESNLTKCSVDGDVKVQLGTGSKIKLDKINTNCSFIKELEIDDLSRFSKYNYSNSVYDTNNFRIHIDGTTIYSPKLRRVNIDHIMGENIVDDFFTSIGTNVISDKLEPPDETLENLASAVDNIIKNVLDKKVYSLESRDKNRISVGSSKSYSPGLKSFIKEELIDKSLLIGETKVLLEIPREFLLFLLKSRPYEISELPNFKELIEVVTNNSYNNSPVDPNNPKDLQNIAELCSKSFLLTKKISVGELTITSFANRLKLASKGLVSM